MKTHESGTQFLTVFVGKIASLIRKLSKRIEKLPPKKPERIVITTYILLHMVMAIYHEPWYDEAVAWQIARCASIKDILFQIPHYEGHPPLWYLVLLPFAKFGLPYEMSLSFVSLVFSGTAMWLLIQKSPFPRIVRLLLPFTFFFFYQYSVISRPYCMMMLAFVLLAMAYQQRNAYPGKYTLSLMLLCLTSAYGIVIAGGLAMVWTWKVWNRRKPAAFFKSFCLDRRLWWLAGLLVFAVCLIMQIMPANDTYAVHLIRYNGGEVNFFFRFLYALFVLPSDLVVSSVYSNDCILALAYLPLQLIIPAVIFGCILWMLIIAFGLEKGTLHVLCVSYLFFSFFFAFVYASRHHIGIALLLFVFWFWISCQEDVSELKNWPVIDESRESLINVSSIILFVIMVIGLSWNLKSCLLDIKYCYAAGRNEATFIKEHGLDQYNIMAGWGVYVNEVNEPTGMVVNKYNDADNLAAYFDHNIFFNFNGGKNTLNYSTHKIVDKKENAETIAHCQQTVPEVLYNVKGLNLVYDSSVCDINDYTRVYSELKYMAWKDTWTYRKSEIYVLTELAEQLGLEEVEEVEEANP